MWVWPAVIVGFFSIPSSKLVGYILPAVPPLAYLIANALRNKGLDSESLPRAVKAFAATAALVCLSAILASTFFNTKSDENLAGLIAAQRQPGEPIVFLKNQFFDIPFYLGLREPVRIFDDWDLTNGPQHDNGRKALYDAGKFDPVRASELLLDDSRLAQTLCAQPTTWIVGPKGSDHGYSLLRQIQPVSTQKYATVWKVSRTAVAARGLCPETPIVGSTDK